MPTGKKFKSKFIQAGLANYPNSFGIALIRKESFDKFIKTLEGKPVIINHQDVTKDNFKDVEVGTVCNVWYDPSDGWYWCDGVITDETAIELIKNKGWSVSCSYNITLANDEGGLENNVHYDIEFLDGVFTHLAIVNNPRYERANIVLNSKTEFLNEGITIDNGGAGSGDFDHAGRPGEVGGSEPAGTGRNGKYEGGKRQWVGAKPQQKTLLEEKKETRKSEKTDIPTIKDRYEELLKRYKENDKIRWSTKDSDEYHRAYSEAEKAKKELTTARREYAEFIMDNFEKVAENPYDDKLESKREYYAQKSKDSLKQSDKLLEQHERNRLPFGQPVVNPKVARIYKKQGQLLDRALDEYDKSKYYAEKSEKIGTSGISSDDKNAIARLAEKYKKTSSSAERRRIIDRVINLHKKSNMPEEKKTQETDLGFSIERNTNINRLQLKFDGKPDENTRSILKSNGFRWSPRENAWQRQLTGNAEWALERVSDKLKQQNEIKNSLDDIINFYDFKDLNTKEQDMALLDELKKLVANIDNAKDEIIEDDCKVDNEHVDKRELIDEVGGILKDKVDDEIIRTIIGKMEKLAYDESEKKDEKKVDNEVIVEEPEKEEKKEEDDKKVEELKDDVKEYVENKCKNSVENSVEDNKVDNAKEDYFTRLYQVYNASMEIPQAKEHITQSDRLEYGKKF